MNALQIAAYFFVPCGISLFLTPLVRRVAIKHSLIAYPRADRWHKHPTALLGGISIYGAVLFTALLLPVHDKNTLGLLLGGTFLFLVGLADDRFHITPYFKLFMQVVAACIPILFGTTINVSNNHLLSIPLTLLWIVGITNSFNLLDNIDGLAAGIAAIAGLMLFAAHLLVANNPFAIFGLVIAGAAIGFLPYNFNPAKIFMGDSGSMLLGFSLAVISITGTTQQLSGLFITMLIPVFILSVPIFDTIFVMIVRRLQQRKIFEGGKDHTSHRLVTLGISQRKTVILLYAISICFGLVGIFYTSRSNLFITTIVAFFATVILLYFGFFLFDVTSRNERAKLFAHGNSKSKNEVTVLNNMFMHKRRVIEVLLDLCFIVIAYYLAYFLRFEGPLYNSNQVLLRDSILWIIIIKMSVFFIFRLYRGMWRYISISDLITITKVVSISSVASILFVTFTFRFHDYSRKVFLLDWLILLFLILGSRITFRILGEFLSRIKEGGKNILIFGAGDTGEMIMREIKRNSALNYNPIGFIDDDNAKVGSKIQGLRVLGGRGKIEELIVSNNIQEIIIAIPSVEDTTITDIINTCREHGIPYRKIKGILDA